MALPLTDLLKMKGRGLQAKLPAAPLQWSVVHTTTFNKLKELFTSELVLAHLDESYLFVVQVDASDVAMGAVLLQVDAANQLRPCTYL